jgi:hypothetical protein
MINPSPFEGHSAFMGSDVKSSKRRNLFAAVLAAAAGAALFSSLAARVRLFRRPSAEVFLIDVPLPDAHPIEAAPEAAPAAEGEPKPRGLRPWFILPLLGLGALVTLILPSSAALLLMLLIVLAGLLIAAQDSAFSLRRLLSQLNSLRSDVPTPSLVARLAAFAKSHRWLATTVFAASGLLCMIGAAHFFNPIFDTQDRSGAVLLMLLGGAALGAAVLSTRSHEPAFIAAETGLFPPRSNGFVVFMGVFLLMVVTAINSRLFSLEMLVSTSTHVQFILWLLGIILIAWGLSGAQRLRLPAISRGEALLLLLIGALAFAVRIYGLESAVRMSVDEVHWMTGIRFLRENASFPILTSGSDYLPITSVWSYVNYLVIQALGQYSFFSLRITAALVGTLNVLAVYGLCRALFNRNVALAAALIMLGFPPHIHFSRIGMAHIADTLFGTLTLLFIVRGLKTNRRADWVLGGIALGLTQYFFEGGRLLFPPLVIAWTVILLISQRKRLRDYGRSYLVFAVALLFTAAPVYYTIYALDASVTSRYSDSGMNAQYVSTLLQDGFDQRDVDELLKRATDPFLLYVSHPEGGVVYYGADQPLVLTLFVPFFLFGVFVLLWRWRKPSVVILIWVVATALGNSLLQDPYQTPRYVNVMPALAICIAVGICFFLSLLLGRTFPLKGRAAALTVIVSAAVSIVMMNYYFGSHLRLFNIQARESKGYGDAVDAVLRVADQYPPGTSIIVISTPEADINVPAMVLNFVSHDNYTLQTQESEDLSSEFFADLPRNVRYAFFIDPADTRMFDLIQENFVIRPPQYSLNDYLPASREYILLYAPASQPAS